MARSDGCLVEVLAVDGVLDSALGVTRDVLAAANRIAEASGRSAPFSTRLVAPERTVTTGTGLRIAVDARLRDRRGKPAVMVVLGMNVPVVSELDAALARVDVRAAISAVARARRRGVLVLGSCSGTFLCAEAGLLDGGEAATSWWLAPYFRARYPAVSLSDDRMVVPGDGVVTAGAALSQIDLMLWLVRRVAGPTVAHLCTRYLVVDERPSQARYTVVDQLAHASSEVRAAEHFARRSLGRPIATEDLARAAKTSVRTLERRFEAALGMSPVRYLRRLRAERAAHLLATTSLSLDAVAEAVGYGDPSTLFRVLKRELGTTARELRRENASSA